MSSNVIEIKSSNQIKSNLALTFIVIGIAMFLFSIIINGFGLYGFLGIILLVIGVFIKIFSSKEILRISNETIDFESKSLLSEFSKFTSIALRDIEDVKFLKRQFLIFGGRNAIANSDTLYFENRIVFKLKNKRNEVIKQVGKKKNFIMAFEFIKTKLDTLKN